MRLAGLGVWISTMVYLDEYLRRRTRAVCRMIGVMVWTSDTGPQWS